MDILEVIRSKYPQLSRTQKRIADYILEQPEEACFASLKELTEAVDATEVTVMNFTRRLGIDGFAGLKRELQDYIRIRLSPNEKISRAVNDLRVRRKSGIFSALLENELQAISSTYASLSEEALREAAAMLRQARRIFLLGHDVSLPAVQFLRLRLHYLGFHAIQLELADRGQLLLSLSQAGLEDLFVAISFPSHAPELARVGEYLRQKGVPLLAITDQPAAPVAACADRALTCATGDLLFYNTLTPPVSLINLLCSFLALEAGEGLQQTRRGVEEAFEAVFADDGAPPAEREPRAVLLAGEGRG